MATPTPRKWRACDGGECSGTTACSESRGGCKNPVKVEHCPGVEGFVVDGVGLLCATGTGGRGAGARNDGMGGMGGGGGGGYLERRFPPSTRQHVGSLRALRALLPARL